MKTDLTLHDVSTKVDALDTKFTQLDVKVDKLDTKVTQLDNKVTQLDTKVSRLDIKVDKLDTKVGTLEIHAQKAEQDMAQVQKTLVRHDEHLNDLQEELRAGFADAKSEINLMFKRVSDLISDVIVRLPDKESIEARLERLEAAVFRRKA